MSSVLAVKDPDRTAPRYRYDFKNSVNKEFLKKFREKYPEHAHYSDEALKKTIKLHNQEIWKLVVNERDGVELPWGMGTIFIAIVPSKHKKIAWKKSVELGVKVYHKNYETDGRLAKIMYSNYGSRYTFEMRRLWRFTAVRQFKNAASQGCIKHAGKYVVLDRYYHLWELFDKRIFKGRAQAKQKKDIKEYNEFEID